MNFNNDAVFKREIVSSNWHWFVVAASLISGAFLRFHYIRRESLWLDEIDAITTSGLPIWQIPSALVWHASPPLDYFILHFVITRVGHSETLVRLPAALAGILAILFAYLAGRILYSSIIGVGASIFLSLSMAGIAYSQEARMYSLFLMFTCLVILSVGLILRYPERFWSWAGAGIVGVFYIYTHYFALLVIACLELLWILSCLIPRLNKRNIIRGVGLNLLLLAAYLPWIPVLLTQAENRGGSLSYLLALKDFWPVALDFVNSGLPFPYPYIFLSLYVIGLLFLLSKKKLVEFGILICTSLLPLLLAYQLPALSSITTPRNMIFAIPAFAIGMSVGAYELISRAISPFMRLAGNQTRERLVIEICFYGVLTTILFFLTQPLIRDYYQSGWWMKDPHTDWRQTAKVIKKSAQPGAIIITNDRYSQYLLTFYLDYPLILNITLSDFIHMKPTSLSINKGKFQVVSSEASARILRSLISNAPVVWLVIPVEEAIEKTGLDIETFESVESDTDIPIQYLPNPDLPAFTYHSPDETPWAYTEGISERIFLIEGKHVTWIARSGSIQAPIWSNQARTLSVNFFAPPNLKGAKLNIGIRGNLVATTIIQPGWQVFDTTIPSEYLADAESIEFQLSVTDIQAPQHSYQIGQSGVQSPVSIMVDSSGDPNYPFADIYLNRDLYSWYDSGKGYGRGYNLVAIDSKTGEMIDWRVFDTDAEQVEADRMRKFINDLPNGTIVAVAVKDDASAALNEAGVEGLRSLGCGIDIRKHFRSAHACIGIKGADPGSVPEAGNNLNASVSVGIDPRNYTIAIASLALK